MDVKEPWKTENRKACHSSIVVLHGVWGVTRAQTEFLADPVEESIVHTPDMSAILCSPHQSFPALLLSSDWVCG